MRKGLYQLCPIWTLRFSPPSSLQKLWNHGRVAVSSNFQILPSILEWMEAWPASLTWPHQNITLLVFSHSCWRLHQVFLQDVSLVSDLTPTSLPWPAAASPEHGAAIASLKGGDGWMCFAIIWPKNPTSLMANTCPDVKGFLSFFNSVFVILTNLP